MSQNKKKLKEKNQDTSRVYKNKKLYSNSAQPELENTKQQKFNFEQEEVEDELDTSFLDKKKRYKKASPTVVEEKEKYPIELLLCSFSLLFLLSSFVLYHYATFDHNKVKIVTKTKEVVKGVLEENVVFLGDSITDFYDLKKYYPDHFVVNSGISGNITDDILDDMEKRVYQYNPSKVFLLIGTNDLHKERKVEEVVENIQKIITEIKENRPKVEIYLESIYPVNKDIGDGAQNRHNEDIRSINDKLEEYCHDEKITYIDLYDDLANDEESLKEEYTKDGLHLNDEGYDKVTEKIEKYL